LTRKLSRPCADGYLVGFVLRRETRPVNSTRSRLAPRSRSREPEPRALIMEETAEIRSAADGNLPNGAPEPEPEVELEEDEEPPRSATVKQEEAKAALGAEGSRPFTMRELLGELKVDDEASANRGNGGGDSTRSAFGEGSRLGPADADGLSYRFVRFRVSLMRHLRSHSCVLDHCKLIRYFATLGF
jgi:hypothetical protein